MEMEEDGEGGTAADVPSLDPALLGGEAAADGGAAIVTAGLRDLATCDDTPPLLLDEAGADAARAAIAAALAGPPGQRPPPGALWARCVALTERAAAELAEALRAALEPTRASRLAGGYRSGKRIDMRAVVAFVASGFRRDRIWQRRTRPDGRAYQVVLAVDDSRSVAAAGLAPAALAAVAALARALARAELGDLAVLAFGGGSADGGSTTTTPARAPPPVLLHSLGEPFGDAEGAALVSGLRFTGDATVGDTPTSDALAAAGAVLDDGAAAADAALNALTGAPPLAQLVLVVGDGRFHEKAPLRAAAAALGSRPGVLVVYVALDTAAGGSGGGGGGGDASAPPPSTSSLADLRTVTFDPATGTPSAVPYLDDFPFPNYVLVRDTASLPRALGGVIRQWVDAAAAAGDR